MAFGQAAEILVAKVSLLRSTHTVDERPKRFPCQIGKRRNRIFLKVLHAVGQFPGAIVQLAYAVLQIDACIRKCLGAVLELADRIGQASIPETKLCMAACTWSS